MRLQWIRSERNQFVGQISINHLTSREVWKEYDLRKHEKKKMKLNSHSFLFSHFEGLQKYITKGLSFLRLGD